MSSDGLPPVQRATVTLRVYEWHRLLDTLEFCMSIIGPRGREAKEQFEWVARQLHDIPVKVEDAK